MLTTESLLERWEDQRAIKNLMGRYTYSIILNREAELFDLFWSSDPGVSLCFNDGAYVGSEKVKAYYGACRERNALVAKLLQKRFPEEIGEKADDEIYGIGPFKVKPMSCPVIEVADDRKTAKGLWFCHGAYNDVESCGPVAHWTWGYFAADFLREGDAWRIWHLRHLNDVDCISGQSWAKEQRPYPDIPEFAPLKDFRYPKYDINRQFRALYSADRPLALCPKMPEPYRTFADTFSYGVGEGCQS